MRRSISNLASAAVAVVSIAAAGSAPAFAAGGGDTEIHKVDWAFGGITGQYDRAQLRRGFQVYQQVCSACHGLERVPFRSLTAPGGPEFDVEAVKALAKEWPNQPLAGPNDEGAVVTEDGELRTRPARLSDPILGPYRNEKQARAANAGALPPDLSLIARARTYETNEAFWAQIPKMFMHILTGYEQKGPDYIHSVLIGYDENKEPKDGLYYNAAYPGNYIAMAAPLYDEAVEYGEDAGAKATLEQHSKDVTAFLAWAADPHLNTRKATGWTVMIYLLITTALLWWGKQRLWSRVKKQPA